MREAHGWPCCLSRAGLRVLLDELEVCGERRGARERRAEDGQGERPRRPLEVLVRRACHACEGIRLATEPRMTQPRPSREGESHRLVLLLTLLSLSPPFALGTGCCTGPAAACRGTSAPCQPPAPRPRPRTSAASPRPRSSTSPPTATTTTTTTSTTSLRRARLARGSSRGASTSTPASRPSRLSSPQQAQVRPRPLLFAVAEQASPPKTFPRSHEPLPQSQHRPPSTRSAPTAPHPSLPLASSRRLASDPPATSLSSASSPSLSSSTSPSSASTRGRRWRPGPWATPSRPSRRRWSTSRTA